MRLASSRAVLMAASMLLVTQSGACGGGDTSDFGEGSYACTWQTAPADEAMKSSSQLALLRSAAGPLDLSIAYLTPSRTGYAPRGDDGSVRLRGLLSLGEIEKVWCGIETKPMRAPARPSWQVPFTLELETSDGLVQGQFTGGFRYSPVEGDDYGYTSVGGYVYRNEAPNDVWTSSAWIDGATLQGTLDKSEFQNAEARLELVVSGDGLRGELKVTSLLKVPIDPPPAYLSPGTLWHLRAVFPVYYCFNNGPADYCSNEPRREPKPPQPDPFYMYPDAGPPPTYVPCPGTPANAIAPDACVAAPDSGP